MAVNYLYQKPGNEVAEKASLEAELTKLQDEFKAGKVRTSVTSGEVGSSSMIEVSIKERIEFVLRRLNQLDPTNYPASMCVRVSRTKLVAYGSP